jgi:hypothetical protein
MIEDLENKAWALDNEPILRAYKAYVIMEHKGEGGSLTITKRKVLEAEIIKRLTDRTHLY